MRLFKSLASIFAAAVLAGCIDESKNSAPNASSAVTPVPQAGVYYVDVSLAQSHFSINPFTHLKDSMNEENFSLPVAYDKYKSLKKGQNIVDDFRGASALLGQFRRSGAIC